MHFWKTVKSKKVAKQVKQWPKSRLTTREITELAMTVKVKYPSPIIAIIGATEPDKEYHDEGVILGQKLALRLDRGTLMTGGVNGVGVDAYIGILKEINSGPIPSDFFILIPDKEIIMSFGREYPFKFQPEPAYLALSKFTGKRLKVERVGESMADRRMALSVIADMFIVLNGSEGTMDEAVYGLRMQKPVVVLPSTGGTAEILSGFKAGVRDHLALTSALPKNLIFPMNTVNEAVDFIHERI